MKYLSILTLILFCSCASYPRPLTSVEIASGAEVKLVDSSNFEAFSALQKITVFWEGHELSFNVQLENSDGAFHLVGLTPVFSRSFLISYSKSMIDFQEHPYFKYPVKPENMLADFQMAFADSQYLLNEPLNLKVSENKREFFSKGKLIQSIDYSSENKWSSVITIVNHPNDYKLIIKTLDFEQL